MSSFFVKIIILLLFTQQAFSVEDIQQSKPCTGLITPIKYFVREGDRIASILRFSKLEPIWCKGCSLDQLLSINKLPNRNFIRPGILILIPFKCEEDVLPYTLIDKKEHRLIEVPKDVASNANWTNPEVKNLSRPKYKYGHLIISKETEMHIVNGENDWTKIDCNGQILDGTCLSKISSYYVKIKNTTISYNLEDRLRSESDELKSTLSPGLSIGMHKYLNRYWSFMSELDLMYQKISPGTYAVSQSKYLFAQAFINFRYELKKWDFGFGLKRGEYAYLYPSSAMNQVEIYALTFVEILAAYRWIETTAGLYRSEVVLDFGTSALGRSLDLKTGQIFTLKNEFYKKKSDGFYIFGLDLIRHEQPTVTTYQSNWGVGFTAGIGWNLDFN